MLRTVYAWTLGSLSTVLWGSLSLIGSVFDGSGRWAHRCMVCWARINLGLMGTQLEIRGLEHVRRDAPQILVANHQSMADILVLAATLPVPFRFVAKAELFDIPFLGWHMRRAGFIPIERTQPRQAARTLLEAADRIRHGVNALVFPEGTRSDDGALLPFHGGSFVLAQRAEVPMLPVAIRGTRDIVRKNTWRIRAARAQIEVMPPISPGAFGSDRKAFAAAVRAAIDSALRAAPGPSDQGRDPTGG